MPQKNYTAILLEDMNHKIDILVEIVTGMQEQLLGKADKTDIKRLDGRLNVVEYSIKKQTEILNEHSKVLAEHSVILNSHDKRLKKLELNTRPSAHASA